MGSAGLALPLLMFRGRANNAKATEAPDDFAVPADFPDRSPDFHGRSGSRPRPQTGRSCRIYKYVRLLRRKQCTCDLFACLLPAHSMSCASVPVDDPTLGQIVGGHFDLHLVAGEEADSVHPHLAGEMAEDDLPVVDSDPEGRGRKALIDDAMHLDESLGNGERSRDRIFTLVLLLLSRFSRFSCHR